MATRRVRDILTTGCWVGVLLLSINLLSGCGFNDINKRGYVFEPAERYDLGSVDESLQLLWTFATDDPIMNPVLIDGERAVYFQTREAVYAVDPASGSLNWRKPIKNPLDVFIVPFGDLLLIPTEQEQRLQGVDVKSGKVRWDLPFYNHLSAHNSRPQMTDLVVDDERAYVLLSLNRGTAVLGVDPQSGEVLWEAPEDISAGLSGHLYQDADADLIHVTSGGEIWTLSKEDGHIIDRTEITFSSTRQPTYVNGVAYTSGGRSRAIDLTTGRVLWSFRPTMCEDKAEQVVGIAPILDDDVAYLLTACEYLIQVDMQSGDTRWATQTPPSPQSFVPAGEVGYTLTPYADLLAVNKADGQAQLLLSLSPPEIDVTTYQHLAVAGDLLVLTPGNNQAFAFRRK